MKAIEYVVRDGAGVLQRGTLIESGIADNLTLGTDGAVSLNLRRADVREYLRAGENLELYLADGRKIVLEGFFAENGIQENRLYLNEDGHLIEASLDASGHVVFSDVAEWGKWSHLDNLIFPDDPMVVADAAVEAVAENEVSTQAVGLGLGALGGGAGLGLAPLVGGAIGVGGLLGGRSIKATVDNPDAVHKRGGGDEATITITGTAQPNSEVVVVIGDEKVTVISDSDGKWTATFDGDDFPADGNYAVSVTVKEPGGTVVDLTGPMILIDTIAPELDVTGGTDSVVNAVAHEAGVTISGTGEAGASISVVIDGVEHTTTVGGDGTWSVLFGSSELAKGELSTTVTVVSKDGFGNATTVTETLVIDTIAPNLGFDAVQVGDNVVNEAEMSAGFDLTGVAEAGASITVTIDGKSWTTVAGGDGTWSIGFGPGALPAGEYDATITAVARDAAGNETTQTTTLRVDTVGAVTLSGDLIEGDDIINATEASDGFSLNGTSQAGSTVVVTFGGVDYPATVGADGSWTLDLPAGAIAGGTYDSTITVTATDTAGNVTTTTRTITVDTEASVTIDAGFAGAEGVINAMEHTQGVTLTGQAEPGATVVVNFNGTDFPATVGGDGRWSLTLGAGDIAKGAYDASITVTSTDLAGNVSTTSSTVEVDTLSFVSFSSDPVEGDGTINAVEAQDGVTLTGMTQAGSTVVITVNGADYTANVAADGSWSVDIPAGAIPAGEGMMNFTATATSPAGNVATATSSVAVDTVGSVNLATPIEGDGIVNAAEASDGVTLTGVAEAGSTVTVTFNGTPYPATVARDGSWTLDIPAGKIPAGEYDAPISVTAVDRAGNSSTLNDSVRIDTLGAVNMNLAGVEGDGVVNQAEAANGVQLTGTTEPGSTVMVSFGTATLPATVAADGSWSVNFPASTIPTGEVEATVTAVATDPAGNETTTTGTLDVDTLVRDFAWGTTPVTGDGVLTGPELDAGLTIGGTTEPGGTVTLSLNGVTVNAAVGADGTWSATFPAGQIPSGEYNAVLTATTTDAAGNSSVITQNVRVDTVAGDLALSSLPIEVDDVINAVETQDGVIVSGTATPGMTVTVSLGGATTQVVSDAAGNWSALYPSSAIVGGTYEATITASISDAYGNSKTVTDTVQVDTVVTDLGLTQPVAGDDLISGAEAQAGVTLTGTVEPGSTVQVKLGTATSIASVDANGNWSADFAAGAIPAGETTLPITVTATDAAGNTALINDTVAVDTLVNELAFSPDPIAGDGFINADEAAQGVTFTGTVEAGSTVEVTFRGVKRMAAVDANGKWAVDYPPHQVPSGEYQATVTVEATDAAGNTATETTRVQVDTTAPDTPFVSAFSKGLSGVRGISTLIAESTPVITEVTADGNVQDLNYSVAENTTFGEVAFTFGNPIPDGSHLVVTAADAAGNEASTLFVLEETGTDVVDVTNPGLSGFEIDAINLNFAEDSQLTLTAEQLEGLSGNSNELTIHGGIDDTVNIAGANGTGQSVAIAGKTYDIYTLGDEGGTLYIHEDITVVI